MYPFIVEDKDKRDLLLKNCLYPINQLWPKGVLLRYLSFNDVFHNQRKNIFEAYELAGGDYHGEPKTSDAEEDVEAKEFEDVRAELFLPRSGNAGGVTSQAQHLRRPTNIYRNSAPVCKMLELN